MEETTEMMTVTVKVSGVPATTVSIPVGSTVAHAIGEAGYGNDGFSITVTGEPADRGQTLYADDVVVLSNRVKGAVL